MTKSCSCFATASKQHILNLHTETQRLGGRVLGFCCVASFASEQIRGHEPARSDMFSCTPSAPSAAPSAAQDSQDSVQLSPPGRGRSTAPGRSAQRPRVVKTVWGSHLGDWVNSPPILGLPILVVGLNRM